MLIWRRIQIFLLFIGLIILTWGLLIHYTAPNIDYYVAFNKVNKTSVLDVLKNANNGDLIFLSGDTFGEKTIRRYHSSLFSHCCLVVRDKDHKNNNMDTAFILESDLGQGYKNGPRILRLQDKLDRWKGLRWCAWKKFTGPERPSTEDILKIARKYLKYDMDLSMASWVFSNYPNSFLFKYLKPEKSVFCSELVSEVLEKLGILKLEGISTSYSPERLANGKLKLVFPSKYDGVIYFSRKLF
jgi:hypothetical protein